jgi:hypothetical protein
MEQVRGEIGNFEEAISCVSAAALERKGPACDKDRF